MSTSPDSNQAAAKESSARAPQRKLLYGLSAFAAVGAAVAGTAVVSAHPRPWQNGEFVTGMIEHRIERLLEDVDATEEQKAQITSILRAAAADVHALRDQHGKAHEQFDAILAATSVDRSQLETLRMQHVTLADDASKRIVAALADAADVLTPEQRIELTQKFQQRRSSWHPHEG